jgi:hypothetical protein
MSFILEVPEWPESRWDSQHCSLMHDASPGRHGAHDNGSGCFVWSRFLLLLTQTAPQQADGDSENGQWVTRNDEKSRDN